MAKLIVGLTTGSLAILSDAIHSLSDILNNIVTWFIVSLSNAPADHKHPYGHGKFETLAVLCLAAFLMFTAFELLLKIFSTDQAEIVNGGWELAVMVGILAINITIALWQRLWAKKLNSKILLADASHTFSDVLTTIAVIIGWKFSTLGYIWLDKLIALIVVVIVIYLAYNLFKNAIPVLVDQIAIEPEDLVKEIKIVSGVEDVVRVRSRWIGSKKAVDVIIKVKSDLSIKESHIIADEIELNLKKKFGVEDISIHIEPD